MSENHKITNDMLAPTVKELIAALRKSKGVTWYVNKWDYGYCDIVVYDKDGKEILSIRNKR